MRERENVFASAQVQRIGRVGGGMGRLKMDRQDLFSICSSRSQRVYHRKFEPFLLMLSEITC